MTLKINFKPITTAIIFVFAFYFYTGAQKLPHLQKQGDVTQLMVNGKPFLILGGELHNSSSSNLEYMEPSWAQLKAMNLNTVLAVVSWQLTEPEEGKFDFSLVDGMLESARKNDLKLVLLWFGSWKNGLSHYVPTWVKEDVKRFPRVKLNSGKATETLSAVSMESRNADAKAFTALMAHIEKVDKNQGTVIMMQVENEVGILGGIRDYSEIANSEFNKPVPQKLINGLKKYKSELQPGIKKYWEKAGYKETGTWKDIFGDNVFAEEAFMAWQYATYINAVTVAGKAEYNLPMFVNAWIVQPTDIKPGDYPSGGPQAHVHDIWRIGAPDIDMKCPDIYLPDFPDITDMYSHSWNPLFVPESFSGIRGASNAFYAIGKHSGIGYSPFGIDNYLENPSKSPLAMAYNILDQLTPLITEAQVKNNITAFSLTKDNTLEIIKMGDYKIEVSLPKNLRTGAFLSESGHGLIIWKEKDEFIVAGSNLNVVFIPDSLNNQMAGFASIYEGEYVNGKWKAGRLLNGDNVMVNYDLANQAILNRTGTGVKLTEEPNILHVKLYRF